LSFVDLIMQFSLVLSLFLGLFAIAFAQEVEEGVLVLTDANIEETVKAHEFILVEFYAPWCGHCKSLAPEYVKAAAALAEAKSDVKLAKVDATEHKTAGSKYDVKGFPTLKFFRSGVATEFGGGRTADEIVSWLKKKTGPVTTPVNTAEELEHMKEGNDAFVIGYFADADSAAAKAYNNAASGNDDFVFAVSNNADVKAALGVEHDSVVIIKTYDNKRDEMRALTTTTTDAITEFVNNNITPLVQTFSDETSGRIFQSAIQKHTLFFTDAAKDHHAPVHAAFSEAAAAYKGKTLVINVPVDQARVAEYFGLTADNFPACVLADMTGGNMKKYPMSGDLKDPKAVKSFIKKALAGKITPSLKSEEPTPEDTTGAVTVLRGKSFSDIVLNNTKDVLVEFYAPWCGHCKNLEPIYNELGEAAKAAPNLVIAKMDATANEIDVPGVDIKGFPTLVWFKGNSKGAPVKYEEGRTKDEMLAYIKKNSFNDVSALPEGKAADAEEDDEDDEEDKKGSEGAAAEEL